jgi:hypothetical protein
MEIICDFAIIGQPGYFILSTEFSNGFHIINERVFWQFRNLECSQNIPSYEVIIIDVKLS